MRIAWKLKLAFVYAIVFLSLVTIFAWARFDIVTNLSITESIKSTVSVGETPIELAVNPLTNRVYVCNFNSSSVSVINSQTQTLITNISVGDSPRSVAVNTKTNKIYVANKGSNTASVIDGETNTVTATIEVEQGPFGIAVNSKTNKIYVTNESSNTVSVIDGETNTVIKSIPVGEAPEEVIVNSNNNKIYVANTNSNTASVIDGAGDLVIKTIEGVGESPVSWTQDEDRNKLYLLAFNGSIYEIDPDSDSIVNNFFAGSKSVDITFHPTTKKIYVTSTFHGTAFTFDTKTNQPLYEFNFIGNPTGAGVNSSTNAIYFADENRAQVFVIEDAQAKIKTASSGEISSGGTTSSSGEITTLTSSDVQEFYDALDEIGDARKELVRASKFARPIAIKISSLIRKIKSVLNKPTEECESLIGPTLLKLAQAINLLGEKSCEKFNSKRCIPTEIADEFSLQFEEAYGELDITSQADIDQSKNPDVCEIKPD